MITFVQLLMVNRFIVMKNSLLKNIILFVLTLTIQQVSFGQWNLIGSPIVGEEDYDLIGERMNMSRNGQRVAIGAPGSDGNGTASGHVRIFEVIDGEWLQMGEDIDGVIEHDHAGAAVGLNEDGSILVVSSTGNDDSEDGAGHVRIFEWNGTEWLQIGSAINGIAYGDEFGYSVDINALGDIVIMGSPYNDGAGTYSGHARIFQLVDEEWEQMGSDIEGAELYDYFGGAVSIDIDGRRVAIGARGNDDNGSFAGHARVFDYEDGDWVQVGSSINGESSNDQSGGKGGVDISGDGSTVVIGSKKCSDGGSSAGQVQIFHLIDSGWEQIGDDIEGHEFTGELGSSVSINEDGSVIAIGEPYKNKGIMQDVGRALVYKYNGTSWVSIAAFIEGTMVNNAAGKGVSIGSSDPLVVAVGMPGGGTGAGRVEIYELNTVGIDENQLNRINFSVFPNPSNGLFTINTSEIESGIAHIYTLDGKCIQQFTIAKTSNSIVDISAFEKGIYYLSVTIGDRSFTEKIIRN